MKSVSELPFSPLPHGNPGPWTEHVVREISSQFKISPTPCLLNSLFSLAFAKKAGPTFARPNGRITSSCPTRRTPGRTSSGSSSRSNHVDCYLISIALSRTRRFSGPTTPICMLPSTFCKIRSLSDLRNGRCSLFPIETTRTGTKCLPPMGFYCRGSLQSHDAAVKAAAPSHHHGAHLARSVSHSHSHPNPAYGYFFYLVYTCAITTS